MKKKKVNEMYDLSVKHVDAVDKPASKHNFLVIKQDPSGAPDLQTLLKSAAQGNTALKASAQTRSNIYHIAFKEGKGHLTPPAGKPTDYKKYGDPVNYAYPIDTAAHIKAAVSYFNHDGQMSAGGYTSSEWSAIGKRIASAAGTGYSYKNGKIETSNNEEVKKMADKQGVKKDAGDSVLPGNAAWEALDANMMQQAADQLVSLKNLVGKIKDRENAEGETVDPDDYQQASQLCEALQGITQALQNVAGAAAVEQNEADNKAGNESATADSADDATVSDVQDCDGSEDDVTITVSSADGTGDEVADGDVDNSGDAEGNVDEDNEDNGPEVGDDDSADGEDEDETDDGLDDVKDACMKACEKAIGDVMKSFAAKKEAKKSVTKSTKKPAEELDKKTVAKAAKEPVKKPDQAENESIADIVKKSIESAGISDIVDSLAKVAKSVEALSGRVDKFEKTPVGEGPVLKNHNGDFYLSSRENGGTSVQKSAIDASGNVDELSKLVSQIGDPALQGVVRNDLVQSILKKNLAASHQ